MEQVERKGKQVKRLKREVRRVKEEAEMAANEMQPQLRKLVDMVKASQVLISVHFFPLVKFQFIG